MTDPSRTNKELFEENSSLKQRILELEQAELDRKRTKEALLLSEEKFFKVFQTSPYAITITRPEDGKFVDVNDAFISITGYTREEAVAGSSIGLNLWVNEDDRQGVLTDLVSGRAVVDREVRFRKKSGEIITCLFSAQKLQLNQGSCILSSINDITERKSSEEALRDSKELYRTFINATSDMVYLKDEQFLNIVANKSMATFFGKPEKEIIGKSDFELMPKIAAEKCRQTDLEALSHKAILISEEIVGDQWYETLKFPVELGSKRVGVGGFIRNTTDRKRAEETLQASEKNFRRSLDESPLGMRIVTANGETIYSNQAILAIYGYESIEELKTTPVEKRYTPGSYAEFLIRREKRKRGNHDPSEYEISIVRKNGEIRHLRVFRKEILWDRESQFQVIYQDITEHKRMEKELSDSEKRYRELSIIDDLTKLYNSRYFYHQLKIEIDRANRYKEQPLALLLLDLDDFKQFNDTYGHVEGDQVLSRLGQVVKRCLRQTDSAYRYGGEEFTILLPMATSKDAAVTAERISTEFKKETFSPASGQGDVHVTVSIGIGQYKLQEDTKVFVNRVDQLMYQAKRNGKNRVCSES